MQLPVRSKVHMKARGNLYTAQKDMDTHAQRHRYTGAHTGRETHTHTHTRRGESQVQVQRTVLDIRTLKSSVISTVDARNLAPLYKERYGSADTDAPHPLFNIA